MFLLFHLTRRPIGPFRVRVWSRLREFCWLGDDELDSRCGSCISFLNCSCCRRFSVAPLASNCLRAPPIDPLSKAGGKRIRNLHTTHKNMIVRVHPHSCRRPLDCFIIYKDRSVESSCLYPSLSSRRFRFSGGKS